MKKKNIVIGIFVLILAAAIVIACGIGSQNNDGIWFQNPNVLTWFNSWGKNKEKPDDESNDYISLASYSLETADFAAYGISPQALGAKVITVDFEPVNTTNKRIGWTCKWKNPNSTWASGKNINDYVDFSPAANFGSTATLAVIQPFGEPVIVTATSRANSALTSSSQFDYVARYSQLWDDGDITLDFGDGIDVFDNLFAEDCYTVIPTECTANVIIELNSDLYKYLLSKGNDVNESVSYTDVTDVIAWDTFIPDFNSFIYSDVAAWFSETGGDTVFYVRVEMTCKYTDEYGSEVVYTFTDGEPAYLSDACIEEMSTPPTDITTNPGGGAF